MWSFRRLTQHHKQFSRDFDVVKRTSLSAEKFAIPVPKSSSHAGQIHTSRQRLNLSADGYAPQFETQPGKTLNLAQDFWLLSRAMSVGPSILTDASRPCSIRSRLFAPANQSALSQPPSDGDGDFSKIAIRRQALRRVQGSVTTVNSSTAINRPHV